MLSSQHKLDFCLICNRNGATGCESYSKLLTTYLISPPERDKVLSNPYVFEFCSDCLVLLDVFAKLHENLEELVECIQDKIDTFKQKILSTIKSDGGSIVNSFRKLSVQELNPEVVIKQQDTVVLLEVSNNKEPNESNITTSPLSETDKINDNPKDDDADVTNSAELMNEDEELVTDHAIDSTTLTITTPPTPDRSHSTWETYFYVNNKRYTCKLCSAVFFCATNYINLARHINLVHSNTQRYKCSICSLIFLFKNDCESHILVYHPKLLEEECKTKEELPRPPSVSQSHKLLHDTQEYSDDESSVCSAVFENVSPRVCSTTKLHSENSKPSQIKIENNVNLEEEKEEQEEPMDCDLEARTYIANGPLGEPDVAHHNERRTLLPKPPWPKPLFSFSELATMALMSVESRTMSVEGIYYFLCENFPYFKSIPPVWIPKVTTALNNSTKFAQVLMPKTVPNAQYHKLCYTLKGNSVSLIREDVVEGSKAAIKHLDKILPIIQSAFIEISEDGNNLSEISNGICMEEDSEDANGVKQIENIKIKVEEVILGSTKYDQIGENDNTNEFPSHSARAREIFNNQPKRIIKPALTLELLIALAILNSETLALSTDEILDFMMTTFRYYQATMPTKITLTRVKGSRFFVRHVAADNRDTWHLNAHTFDELSKEISKRVTMMPLAIYWAMDKPENFENIFKKVLGENYDFEGFFSTYITNIKFNDANLNKR